nr:hypothetical protein [Tanacetum cinerariifolium]
ASVALLLLLSLSAIYNNEIRVTCGGILYDMHTPDPNIVASSRSSYQLLNYDGTREIRRRGIRLLLVCVPGNPTDVIGFSVPTPSSIFMHIIIIETLTSTILSGIVRYI